MVGKRRGKLSFLVRTPGSAAGSEQEAWLGRAILERPLVSVIVPAYGVAELLGEALTSLQAQRWPHWEAIVVDDGAPDDVAGAFEPFAEDPRFRLLRTDNGGLATARNRGVAASRAPYIALLDGDDIYEPDYLERMIALLQMDHRLGFVSCDATMFGARPWAGHRYSERYPLGGPVTLDRVLSRDVQIVVSAMIRRSALEQVGGFDGALRSVEDLDLWIRLLAAGWGGAIVQKPLVRYRRRPGSLSTDDRGMLTAACAVYRKACTALADRPEATTAARTLARYEQLLRYLDGQEAILKGDIQRGLRLLDGMEKRSPRWRLAMPIMRRAPWLAAPMLRMRSVTPRPRSWLLG